MKTHKAKPPLKVCEWSKEQGGGSYIAFDEFIDIPGLEKADIRIEFDNARSIADVQSIASKLKEAGFTFVVQKH